MRFILDDAHALPGASADEIARVVLTRTGLLHRRKRGAAKLEEVLFLLNEMKKASHRDHKPEEAMLTVDTMAGAAHITSPTMYFYLRRWLDLNVIRKNTIIANGKVTIGYEINGPNLVVAFRKAEMTIQKHMVETLRLVRSLQFKPRTQEPAEANTQQDTNDTEPPLDESSSDEKEATALEAPGDDFLPEIDPNHIPFHE